MIIPIFITFSLFIALVDVVSDQYGYFNSKINRFKICRGPKRKECSINSVDMLNESVVNFDMLIKEDVAPTKVKIIAYYNGKQMLRLPVKNPCDHLFIKPIIMSLFNITNGCVISKGHYNFNLDMSEMFLKYYNGMFLYGNWTFRSVLWSNACNFICTVTDINLYPKKEGKQL